MTNKQITRQAAEAILNTLQREGRGKYPHDPWPARTDAEDIDHAMNHLLALAQGDSTENHLHHALTRLALILARQHLKERNP